MGSLLLILKQCLTLKQAIKKYQFSLSVRTDRYQYMYHISKVSLMPSNDYYWYQILDCRKMLRNDEEINGLTNMWPGRGCVGPSLYETGKRTPVVIWREWKRPLDLWMVIASLPWQITGGIMGSWLCVKSTSASDGDICSHYKNQHRTVFM